MLRSVFCKLRKVMDIFMYPERALTQELDRPVLSIPPKAQPSGVLILSKCNIVDNSQNGLISDVWDQLRIRLFKSNFKY